MGLLNINKGANAIKDIVGDVTDTIDNFNPTEQVSRRHEKDMLSDNTLSKNARPMTLVWLLCLLTISIALSCFGIEVPVKYQETIFWGLSIALPFYFGGRTFEKFRREDTKLREQQYKDQQQRERQQQRQARKEK